ncbi:MAG: class I SAM-dependent methyltransferase [Deltaproteobacteria bacterium]|nr:class I SAM-dependent methyltransferase [Deltaproteobacteria bacterium]MBW2024928.1 class I SAM-dependent methyltransferase [Deltaproteobacteria bacterium]MBW2124957.1 class I SAM-dependent methyltransferase [Deltaproteobacteria bacterium]
MQLHKDSRVFNQGRLKQFIINNGCFSPQENEQIYERWFASGPRYLFRAVDNKYHISQKTLCDVGCAYGTNLLYCTKDSYGIEIDKHRARFARSLGLKVYELDIQKDSVADLPKVEVIWCSAVLEHVECPHTFLKRLHVILKPGGIMALYVPTIPLLPIMSHIPRLKNYISGYDAYDHVNAFVPSTLQFSCEKAGFRTLEISPFYPGIFGALNTVPLLNRIVSRTVYVGKKV